LNDRWQELRPVEKAIASQLKYPVIVQPLPLEEGGGFDATMPDLRGSKSEGKKPEEALSNVQDAVSRGLTRARDMGRNVPAP